MATYLVPHVGYDKAASIAAKASEKGKNIREIVLEENILPENELTKTLFSENIPGTEGKEKIRE
jgi:aspartate ammonia-lyase